MEKRKGRKTFSLSRDQEKDGNDLVDENFRVCPRSPIQKDEERGKGIHAHPNSGSTKTKKRTSKVLYWDRRLRTEQKR